MAREDNIIREDNRNVFIGDDVQLRFTIDQGNNDDPALATPQDISGFSFEFTVKERKNSTTFLIQKTDPSVDIVITTPLSGIVVVTILDTDTNALEPGNYCYTFKRIDAGAEATLSTGRFLLQRNTSANA